MKTWSSFVPLIGAFDIAAQDVLGSAPQYSASYTNFAHNESYYEQYFKDTPRIILGESTWDEGGDSYAVSRLEYVDVVVGVPPCSSLSGSNPNAGFRSGSGCTMFNAIDTVFKYIKPKVFIFENAPVLASATSQKGIKTRQAFAEIGEKYGYSFDYLLTNTIDHGLPQYRKRCYAVGHRGGTGAISKLNATSPEYTNIRDYIDSVNSPAEQIRAMAYESLEQRELIRVIEEYFNIDLFSEAQANSKPADAIVRKAGRNDQSLFAFADHLETLNFNPRLTKRIANDFRGIKGFGYSPIQIIGKKYSNVLFQQSLPVIMTHDRRLITQAETAALMGLPDEFGLMSIDGWRAVLTQSCPVTTNKVALRWVLKNVIKVRTAVTLV